MRKIMLFLTIIFFNFFCYSREIVFKTTKEVIATNGNIDSPKYRVKKNELVTHNDSDNFFYYEDKFKLYADYEGDYLGFDIHDLELQEEHVKAPESYKNSYWVMSYYYEMLKKKDISVLTKFEPYWKPGTTYIDFDASEWDWNYLFNPLYLIIDDYFIYGSHNEQYGDLNILGKGISSSEDEFIFSVFKEYNSSSLQVDSLQIEWKKLKGHDYNLVFKLDGDYLHVYKNSVSEKNLLYTLVRTNKDTLAQIKKFVKKGTFDLSEVTFPRHADGSCDYDGSKKTVASQAQKATSPTNVAPNTTMTVRENLKLRSGEDTSTQVLAVMSAGAKVRILELGKAETIDGIPSNWVKVEVQQGAKDRDGKPIKKGTVGWCFGGYLE